MSVLRCSVLRAGLSLALLTSSLQAQDGRDAVDHALAQLRDLQQQNGSYGDVVTTCQALLALHHSHRHYAETDGPFVRTAVQWLSEQVGADGRPLAATPAAADRLALWIEKALQPLTGPTATATLERLRSAAAHRPVPAVPDLELYPLGEGAEQDLRPALDEHLARMQRQREASPAEFRALLRQLPAVLELLASDTAPRDPVAPHWSVLAAMILGEPAPDFGAAEWAAYARALSLCIQHAPPATSESASPPLPRGTRRGPVLDALASYTEAAEAALGYLATQQEDGRFGFFGQPDPGITAMALAAVLQTCQRRQQEPPAYVAAGLDWLVSLQDEQGAIHGGQVRVYVTSAAILALKLASRPPDQPVIERAAQYLQVVQADEGEGYDSEADWAYGGIGYGGDLRPDLSNTQFGLEALRAAGIKSDTEAFRRALTFLQRCQNDPELNDRVVVRADGKTVEPGADGGAMYYPGDSKAGLVQQDSGTYVARSYGSMTYALLKSYLFAGLSLEDPRLQAALSWIRNNYTVEYNPGFDLVGQPGSEYQGLYYYYYTMAKALDVSGLEVVTTPDGKERRWRDDLSRHILEQGFTEGFWSNDRSARWWEEIPVLATSYALVALDHALPEAAAER